MSDSPSNWFDEMITDIGLKEAAAFDGSQVDSEPTIEDFSPNPELLKNVQEFINNQYSDEVLLAQRSKEDLEEIIKTIGGYKEDLLGLIRDGEIKGVYRDLVIDHIMDLNQDLNFPLDDLDEQIAMLVTES